MKSIVTILIACALLVGACDSKPSDFESELAKAEAQLGLGRPDKALYAYRSLVRHHEGDPRWAGVMLRIAELYSTVLGDSASALNTLSEVIDRSPLTESGRKAMLVRAELRVEEGDYPGAIEDYAALIKHFPEGEGAMLYRVLLASVYLTARDFMQARIEIKPLIEAKEVPNDIREKVIFIAAESFFLDGNVKRASGYYQWLLKDFPESSLVPEAKLHLATCIEEMGYMGIARQITQDAAEDYPNKAVIEARLKSIDYRGSKSASQMREELGIPEPAEGDEDSKNVYKGDGLN